MIAMIFAAVALACGVYVTFLVGKDFGREEGFYEGRREAYREVERLIDDYIENLNKEFDAKDSSTKGA
jgi:hypothetical protein|nr:MAG TPA: hypothetical protein [Caudoviricetes sp.]